jgi:hypothetical protein
MLRGILISTFMIPALCAQGIRSDSYGQGIESGYRGTLHRPEQVDEICFSSGLRRAATTLAEAEIGERACRAAFASGFDAGFTANGESIGDPCRNDGYMAGVASLDVGAREGNLTVVGAECVQEYGRGFEEGRAGRVAEPKLDQRLAACYRVGFYDSGV